MLRPLIRVGRNGIPRRVGATNLGKTTSTSNKPFRKFFEKKRKISEKRKFFGKNKKFQKPSTGSFCR